MLRFSQLIALCVGMNERVVNMYIKGLEGSTSACTGTEQACKDKITWLPGMKKLPGFEMYSGYLKPTATKKLHYWFVQSQSDPDNDPVLVWFNGGPGCSSMEGFMAEHGPLHMEDDDTITLNPHAWNQKANMVYIEAPVGVGYSTGSKKDLALISDTTTAIDNRDAIKDFFVRFPQYLKNGLFISGESYAGVYVPTLIAKIVDDKVLSPHYKGAIIGNGYYSAEKNQNSMIFFAKYHGLIDKRNWDKLLNHCCTNRHPDMCDFFNYVSMDCESLVNQVLELTWGGGLDVYNLYAECAGGVSKRTFHRFLLSKAGLSGKVPTGSMAISSAPPCTNDTALEVYFNSNETKRALHVDDIDWTLCNEELDYIKEIEDVTSYIKHALKKAPKSRILLFAGDVDMACNFLGGEEFVEALALPLVTEYQEWSYVAADGTRQVGGWCKQFERLTWATVKGAGHMVPTDMPIPAYNMLEAFLEERL